MARQVQPKTPRRLRFKISENEALKEGFGGRGREKAGNYLGTLNNPYVLLVGFQLDDEANLYNGNGWK